MKQGVGLVPVLRVDPGHEGTSPEEVV
ncbi:MAG: hypothetical protein QOE66_3059, partial [Chloroflexota bacterium]|nr:hypothetical protein [Chloroflexota bacterium]